MVTRKNFMLLWLPIILGTMARIIYSGWFTPILVFPMRGDGIRGIFSGVDGYFAPGPLRDFTLMILNHPYPSVTFYYSVFHPLCATLLLPAVLAGAAHLAMICVILSAVRAYDLPGHRAEFLMLIFIIIFNWAPFYDGVTQGFPPEFAEVMLLMCGFWLFMAGSPVLAGIAVGIASTIKLLPVLYIIYFAYKKQFKLVISSVLTSLLFGILILLKENMGPNLMASMASAAGGSVFGHSARDPGLGAFIDFVFHSSLCPQALKSLHWLACALFLLVFIALERSIPRERDKYLFGFSAVALSIFQVSPRISEMFWYLLLLPAVIFNIYMLVRYRDRFFSILFFLAYIFLHGFSLLNFIFRSLKHLFAKMTVFADPYLFFNEHGGAFIGLWALYFSTYGLALKYLTGEER